MNKYGVLLAELNIEKLGKSWTIITVIVFIMQKIIFAVLVVIFY
jgi:hypothetical protein